MRKSSGSQPRVCHDLLLAPGSEYDEVLQATYKTCVYNVTMHVAWPFWPRRLLFLTEPPACAKWFWLSMARTKLCSMDYRCTNQRCAFGNSRITALKRGIPLGARGGLQMLGMVFALTAVVDVTTFSSAEKPLVQSRHASDVDDSECLLRRRQCT